MIYVIGLLGFTLAFLLPGHYFPWTSVQQESAAAVGALLCGLGVAVTTTTWPIRVPNSSRVLTLVAVVPVAQWLAGIIPYHSDALLAVVYLLAAALTVVTACQLRTMHGERFVYLSFVAILIAAIASVGIGLAQWLNVGQLLPIEMLSRGERVSANLRQPNQLASLLGVALVGVAWMYERRRFGPFSASLAAGFLGFGLLLTQSRTPWIFLVLIALLWLVCRHRVPLRLSGAAVVTVLVLFAAGVVGWDRISDVVQSGISAQDLSVRAQTGTRWVIWKVMAAAALHSPWAGYGWMQIPAAQVSVAIDNPPVWHWLTSSHNVLLDLVLWNGWLIGVPIIAAAGWWVVSRLRACRNADNWAAMAALSVLAAHSMVELPMHYAFFLLLAAVFIGIVEADVTVIEARPLALGRIAFCAALLALGSVLFAIDKEYLEVEEQARRARLKEVGFIASSQQPAVPDVVLLDGLREYLHIWLTEAHEGMTEEELDRLRVTITRYPVPPALFRYAHAAAMNGRPAEAERALAVLCMTAMPDNCQLGRQTWGRMSAKDPRIALVRFPDSPHR